MPNWCMNEVTITTVTDEEAEAFMESIKDGDNHFSFNKIKPMPKELKGTRSPADIVSQREYDSWVEHPDNIDSGLGKPITQEMSNRLKKEYGYDNWYDWCVDNWGTKWDVDCGEGDWWENTISYEFDTAWSPPEGIYNALVKQYPNLEISWFYREDGMQQAGWLNND